MVRTLGAVTVVVFAAPAAVVLILTGLVGYQPLEWSVDPSPWARGVWTGHVIPAQVAAGVFLLLAACLATVRVVRRLGPHLRRRRR